MSRLCIYVIYDQEGIIDEYIGYMLQELRKVNDMLVVVCNNRCITKGINNVQIYADKLFYRENIGFDAGAYKDTICKYLGWEEVYQYDELMLVNDSFYGPLYSLEDTFEMIEKVEADYWGITRSPSGVWQEGEIFNSHIQSYFLAFRKAVLCSLQFRAFWEKMEYPETLCSAVYDFELGLNDYLAKLGFRGVALTDLYKTIYQQNENPYLIYSLELIRDQKIPIFKRKSIDFRNKGFGNALEALKYIKEERIYDVELIKKHLLRISQSLSLKSEGMMDICRLEKFYHSHANVFIYGAGTYGKNLALYFEYKGWVFSGFLVTNAIANGIGSNIFDEVDIGPEDGIIIAVGDKEVFLEILSNVEKRCSKEQVFAPNYVL